MPAHIKVVHVVVAGEIGGAENFLINLASRPVLSGADHCVTLMTPNPKLRAFFANAGLKVRDRGPVRENPAATLWRSFGPFDIAWLGRVLQEEGASLIHAHTYGSHALAARAGLRHNLPVLRTEHGVRHYRDPSCALFRHWALRHTTRVVAVSAFVGRTVAAIAPHAKEKIQIIPNGIDMARFQPRPPWADGPFTFTMVGRLDPIKRISLAIEAVARTPDVRLDIAGEGREQEGLQRLARLLSVEGRVRFLGYLPDPRPVIASSDAIIICSRVEGLPLSVIEAAAMQRPAVAFDCGGVPEIVQDRQTGWLVKEHSINALASALTEAAANRSRAAEFGANARKWVEGRFGIDAMCKGYAAVYRELAGSTAAAHFPPYPDAVDG
ncbi:MAG: glycosyltransferase family 4 protein [Alphaproteobacteria bacterium]|nr:glycosyltransferase family 4 protein [Alphaproteobacteria bacterium]MDE2492618.1 glycosyltransferase family 4 protein [Alphaproteobacteria bacterium]